MQYHMKVFVTGEEILFVMRPKINIFFLLSSPCQGYLGHICSWIDFQEVTRERIYTMLENSEANVIVKTSLPLNFSSFCFHKVIERLSLSGAESSPWDWVMSPPLLKRDWIHSSEERQLQELSIICNLV